MNILMLNRFDIYTIPGTIRMVELAQQFVKKDHRVTLCYYPNEERRKYLPLLRNSDPEGMEIVKLNSNKTDFIRNLSQVRRFAKSADIIHFQKCFPETALVALWVSYLEDKPIHYDWDDLELAFVPEWTKSKIIYQLVKIYEDWLPRMVDSVSYSTDYVKKLALDRGADSQRLMHAPVGANIDRFHPSVTGESIKNNYFNRPLIVYIGQLEEGSYAELYLKAASEIVKKIKDIHFLLVGGGRRLPFLQELSVNLGLENYVSFTNYVPHEKIPEYVASATVCVACFEDNELTRCKSPLKIAEYLASGKPIVASDVGDISKMVDGAGIIVPSGNPEKLAEGIIQLLNNPAVLDEMKIKARKKAESFYNWSVIADRFLDTYKNTINYYNQV